MKTKKFDYRINVRFTSKEEELIKELLAQEKDVKTISQLLRKAFLEYASRRLIRRKIKEKEFEDIKKDT